MKFSDEENTIGKILAENGTEEEPKYETYVLAKDLAELTEQYQIKYIQPIDMFPFTSHVETVCLLSLKDINK